MPRKSSCKVVGPRDYQRHPDALPLAPALQEVLDEGNHDLFKAVSLAAVRARAAGEDVTDPTTITLLVAHCRAELGLTA